MKLYTGTSGWAYKEWKGPFYPETLKNDAMLAYYSEQLPAVEVNNTFYRMPAEGRARQVARPGGPRLPLRAQGAAAHHAPQPAHRRRLARLPAREPPTASSAGRSAPSCSSSRPSCARTCRGCATSSRCCRPAARPPSSSATPPGSTTRSTPRCATAAPACASPRAAKTIDTPFVPTAGWGYLRLRREDYDDAALERWAARLREAPWSRAFVFFKHEDAGAGPRLAARFRELFGEG